MIVIENIHKAYGGEAVLRGVSFELAPASTLSVLGESGCGKSTLLKVMAGIEVPDGGRFLFAGQDMFALPAQRRGVVYLSQEPLLFPHLNVAKNLGYGLMIRHEKPAAIRSQVQDLAAQLGLSEHLHKMPDQLSGGQRQRVSFGRALIINPAAMLLDEPFASLDGRTRSEMQQLYKGISKRYGITSLFVTHDLKEALIMADDIAHMRDGLLHVYPSLRAFAEAPDSGVAGELNFWENFASKPEGTF